MNRPRKQFDMDGYVEAIQSGPCFICEIAAGNPDYPHHIVYEDERAIAFLNKYPTLISRTDMVGLASRLQDRLK